MDYLLKLDRDIFYHLDLDVDIKNTANNTVTINAEAISVKNITKIFVEWGDGKEDNLNLHKFDLSHTYDKAESL